MEHDFEGIGRRVMELTGRRLVEVPEDNLRVLLAIRDVTEIPGGKGEGR